MRTSTTLLLATVFWGLASQVTAEPTTPGFQIIVHPANPASSVDRKFLADAFLKKTTRWPTNEVIRPIDLSESAATRQKFSQQVLTRSVQAIRSYWQQMIFSGRDVPPPEFDTENEVIEYVAKHSGAVGYVSVGANVSAVKTVSVQ